MSSEGGEENVTYLLVDDEQMELEFLKHELTPLLDGDDIVSFSGPNEAYQYAREHTFDVAFLDIEMPKMNGIELGKLLKELNTRINIIFVTAHSNYAVEAFGLHASGYVLKPVTGEVLAEELKELRYEKSGEKKRLRAITFGQFDLLLDGGPVRFGRAKSKELLAYLIHKKGGGVTRKEVAAVLFEDIEYSRTVQDYLSKIVRELDASLEKAGITGLFLHDRNYYSVNTDLFSCDAYEYGKNNMSDTDENPSEYLAQYSWAEGEWEFMF